MKNYLDNDIMEKGRAADIIVRTILQYYPSAQGIYLFGSYLTENEWPDSDVDIAVLLSYGAAKKRKPYDTLQVQIRPRRSAKKKTSIF